jgi:hypothetical protein
MVTPAFFLILMKLFRTEIFFDLEVKNEANENKNNNNNGRWNGSLIDSLNEKEEEKEKDDKKEEEKEKDDKKEEEKKNEKNEKEEEKKEEITTVSGHYHQHKDYKRIDIVRKIVCIISSLLLSFTPWRLIPKKNRKTKSYHETLSKEEVDYFAVSSSENPLFPSVEDIFNENESIYNKINNPKFHYIFPSFNSLCRFFGYNGYDIEFEKLLNHFDIIIANNASVITRILKNGIYSS